MSMPGVPGSSSSSWTIVALLTFLTLIPSLLMCMTPFARLLIVFHFLRQALGLTHRGLETANRVGKRLPKSATEICVLRGQKRPAF